MRTRWYRYRTPSPHEVLTHTEPEGSFERTLTFDLERRRETGHLLLPPVEGSP